MRGNSWLLTRAVILIGLIFADVALADTIALRSGIKYEGSIANREQLRSQPQLQETIAILTNESPVLVRIPAMEIEYVVLEDSLGRQVIDLSGLQAVAKPIPAIAQSAPDQNKTGAINLMIGGALMGGVGALVKLGGPKVTVTESHISADEKSYNTGNYAMMAGGAAVFLIGVAMLNGGSSTPADSPHGGLTLSTPGDESGICLSAGWGLSF